MIKLSGKVKNEVVEQVDKYEKLKSQAIQQRNLLWEKHLGFEFEE